MRIFGVSMSLAFLILAGCSALDDGAMPSHGHSMAPPPENSLIQPGPGVGGPGPGVLVGQQMPPMPIGSSQLAFRDPEGMEIRWDVTAPNKFDSEPLVVPGRYSFAQSAIYRLKISNIPGRPGVELYPTIEVAMAAPRTQAFLDHSAVPVQFTEEDFDQVLSGNFVTKVIYLPNPEYQELALAGVDTLVSTRLDPGVDPIREASRRGAILAVVRLGNKDLQSAAANGEAGANGITQTGFHAALGGGHPGRRSLGRAHRRQRRHAAGLLYFRRHRAGVWDADVRHADRPGWSAAHSLGNSRRTPKYTMVNHTHVCMPEPTHEIRVDVKHEPGYCAPTPPNHVRIVERTSCEGKACGNGQPCDNASGPAAPANRRRLARWNRPPSKRTTAPKNPFSRRRLVTMVHKLRWLAIWGAFAEGVLPP